MSPVDIITVLREIERLCLAPHWDMRRRRAIEHEAGAVGDDNSHLLDQCGAGGLDGDAWQHTPARVSDEPGDAGVLLRGSGEW